MKKINKLDIKTEKLHDYFKTEDVNSDDFVFESIELNKNTLINSKSIYQIEESCRQILDNIIIYREKASNKDFKFNTKKIKQLFKDRGLIKTFPNFNIDKYIYYLENPILEVKNHNNDIIKFDSFWVKKNIIAIHQMIFNEMDLYILNIGKEGSGKSCWSSQQILYFHNFLTEVGLIDYAFDFKRMYFADIISFLEEHETQKFNDYFRIECLDEGNELGRSNYHDATIKQFKYDMRTERKMLRITMINMQQIGELDVSISLSRVNFIYDCRMGNNIELGTLNKGYIDMYIVPRSDKIYSYKHKRNITRKEILNTISKKLDNKKEYYVDLPREFIIHDFRFDNFWGFNKNKYDIYVKDLMKKRKFAGKDLKLTSLQAYIIYTKIMTVNFCNVFDLSVKSDKKMYEVIRKLFKKIENYFLLDQQKLLTMQNYYKKDD